MSITKKKMPAGAAISPFDVADHLRTPQEVADYLEAVFEDYDGDSRVIVAALGDAAKALGMQKVAQETGLNREGLYKALSGEANPSFDTVLRVMNAVGVELRPKAVMGKRAVIGMGMLQPRKKGTPKTSKRFVRDPATGNSVGSKQPTRKHG